MRPERSSSPMTICPLTRRGSRSAPPRVLARVNGSRKGVFSTHARDRFPGGARSHRARRTDGDSVGSSARSRTRRSTGSASGGGPSHHAHVTRTSNTRLLGPALPDSFRRLRGVSIRILRSASSGSGRLLSVPTVAGAIEYVRQGNAGDTAMIQERVESQAEAGRLPPKSWGVHRQVEGCHRARSLPADSAKSRGAAAALCVRREQYLGRRVAWATYRRDASRIGRRLDQSGVRTGALYEGGLRCARGRC